MPMCLIIILDLFIEFIYWTYCSLKYSCLWKQTWFWRALNQVTMNRSKTSQSWPVYWKSALAMYRYWYSLPSFCFDKERILTTFNTPNTLWPSHAWLRLGLLIATCVTMIVFPPRVQHFFFLALWFMYLWRMWENCHLAQLCTSCM